MIVDRDLVARLEASAATVEAATAESFGRTPGDPARVQRHGNGALVALGAGRFVNRAIGITLDEPGDAALDELEAFFAAAGVPAAIEVSSWTSAAVLARLARRGYVNEWFRDVYVRSVADVAPPSAGVTFSRVTADTVRAWQDVVAAGNEIADPGMRTVSDQFAAAVHLVAGSVDLLAEIDGEPVGCGSIVTRGRLGWLGGAATVPAHRGKGVQAALLAQRIAVAAESGCDLVAATAEPDGGSARNLSRAGFTRAYVQVVMTRPAA